MADKKIEVRVIAPKPATDKSTYKYKSQVDMVIMRCTNGDLGVLPGRLPCTMVLDSGIMRIYDEDKESYMAVKGGVANVSNDVVTILSESALWAEDINKETANESIVKFEESLSKASDELDRANFMNELKFAKVQLEVLNSGK